MEVFLHEWIKSVFKKNFGYYCLEGGNLFYSLYTFIFS